MPIDYETALQRLMSDEGLERGQAVDRLVKAYDAGDPELKKVTGLPSGLFKDYTKAAFVDVGAEVPQGALDEVGKIPVFPFNRIPALEQSLEPETRQYPTIPGAKTASKLVGSALPFAVLEGAA